MNENILDDFLIPDKKPRSTGWQKVFMVLSPISFSIMLVVALDVHSFLNFINLAIQVWTLYNSYKHLWKK